MGLVVMGLCLLLALSPGAASPVAALPETTTFYGVIVGVADYPGGGGLAFTDDDAREIKDALLRYGNWEEANIQLLLDSAATKSGIQAAIAQIGAVADADDVVLFFFSGDGTTGSDVVPLDETDGVDEYICSYGSTFSQYIRDDELSQWLGGLPTTNVVVIIDTCFSGGQIEVPGRTVKSLPGTPSGLVQQGDGFTADLTQRIAPHDMDDNAGCVVMTAADADELSYEFYFLQNGLFSFFVIRGLERYWDRNGDGELSAEELSVYSLVGTRWLGSRLGIGRIPRYTMTTRLAILRRHSWRWAWPRLPASGQPWTGTRRGPIASSRWAKS